MPVSRAAELQQIPGVRVAVPHGQTTDKSDAGWGVRVIDGIDFDAYARLSGLRVVEGRPPRSGDEAIIDPVWMGQRKAKVGGTVRVFERDFRIVGVYEPPGGARIKIPLATMQENAGVDPSFCTSILVSVNNPAEQDAVAERIHAAFPDDQLIFTRDLHELYASSVPALDIFIDVVVGVAAVISMLVILLAMYTTVTERTRQIGVLKSLGMSNGAIAWVIEQEAIIVSLLGVGALCLPVSAGATASHNDGYDSRPRPAATALDGLPLPDRPRGTGQRPRAYPIGYQVVEGDSLWGLTRRHLGPAASDARVARTWPLWYATNEAVIGSDPDLLIPGTVLQPPPDAATGPGCSVARRPPAGDDPAPPHGGRP